MPGGNAIAISGNENLEITVNSGLSTAFGFYFHEPATLGLLGLGLVGLRLFSFRRRRSKA